MREQCSDSATKMSCREFVDTMPGYLEGELPVDRRRAFEGHLDRCAGCATYLANYRQTIRLAREALNDDDEAALDRDLIPELLRNVLEARKPPRG